MIDTLPAANSLAVHAAFLRAFARALVRGDAEIDDVVQDAFVVALGKEPRDPAATRSWLAGIIRNLVGRRRRRAAVRERHLPRLPRAPAEPSPDEIATREEERGRVVAALLAEDELYRRPLLLRYYEGLPPTEIAERMGVPLETVRTRLRRGLARLRTSLDEKHGGDRRAWASALLPLLRPAPSAAAGLAVKVVAAVVLLAGAGVAFRSLTSEAVPAPPREEPEVTLLAVSDAPPPAAPEDESPVAEPAALPVVAPAPEGSVRVLVVDDQHRAVPDAEVRLRGMPTTVRTDAEGIALLDWPEQATPGGVVVRASGRWWQFKEVECGATSAVIVVPSLRTVTGRVIDDEGRVLAGARVVVVSPGDLSGWASDPKHAHAQVEYPQRPDGDFLAVATADGRGRFSITVPAGTPQVLMALTDLHLTERFVVQPDVAEVDLTARLGAELTVFLRGPEGEIEKGGIGLQWEDDYECSLEAEGSMPLVLTPLFPGRWRVLGAGGGGLLTRDRIEFRLTRGERREIEVRLAPRPAPDVAMDEWRVRILDADGEPMSREELRRWRGSGEDRVRVLFEENGGFRASPEIGPDGTFTVKAPQGIGPFLSFDRPPYRDFRVRLEPGGGDAEIRFPIRLADADHQVAGRVLDPEGNPVAGASVTLSEERADRTLRIRTGPDGSWVFERVVSPPWHLFAWHPDFTAARIKLDSIPGAPVELRLLPPPEREPAGRLEVRILLARGDLAKAEVIVSPGRPLIRMDALGRGAVDLPPGLVTINAWIPIEEGIALDTATAEIRDRETTTVSLCAAPLTSARITVVDAPAGAFDIGVKDVSDRWIAGGGTVDSDRPFRILYPLAGARLGLFWRDHVLWIDAPRGEVTVRWSDAR